MSPNQKKGSRSNIIPGILPPLLLYLKSALLLRQTPQFEVPPVMERPRSGARNHQESRRPHHRNQVERQEEYEFDDLDEGEGRVYGGCGGFSEHLDRVRCVVVEDARGSNEIDESFADERCLQEFN